jgi:hypothetical protein
MQEVNDFNKDDVEPSTLYDEIIEETLQESEVMIIDKIQKKHYYKQKPTINKS